MRENTFKLASTQGYTSLGVIEDLHSLFYFNGLRAITQFLLGEDSGDSKSLASVNYVERMNVESRHEVLTKLWSILADWPHRFLAMCETYRSPYTRLVCERRVLPWWLYSVCSNELRRDPLAISAKEVQYIQHTVQDADGRFSFTAARKCMDAIFRGTLP
uniref:Uncharacterized protein n=1 Tax=Curvibacter symbiont subsp. Hydra magnipapillata TaxID=667019 RepID=C9YBL5_CURXX|nr:hypothetical protein Csp_A15160 [Curvibacter putative symbiont of Hydra magnipapillata]